MGAGSCLTTNSFCSRTAYEEKSKKSPDHESDMKSTGMLRKITDVCILLIANGLTAVLENPTGEREFPPRGYSGGVQGVFREHSVRD